MQHSRPRRAQQNRAAIATRRASRDPRALSIQPVSALVAAIVSFAIGGSVLLREPRRRVARPVRDVRLQHRALEPAVVRRQALRRAASSTGRRCWWRSRCPPRRSASSRPSWATRPARRRSAALDRGGRRRCSTRCSASRGSSSRCTRPIWFGVAFLAYVFAGLYLSVFYLYRRYRATPSRVEKTRLLYLVVGGFATVTSALLEALPHGPNFGNVFIIVYLYFLSQNLVRYRLLDLNELLGRMVVLGTLVFILALIYGVLVALGRPGRAGAVLLQHAAGVGGDRHPDRAAARPRRGGDQPLDVPGEVRAVAGASRCCAPSWPTSSTCACWCRACWRRWRTRGASPTRRSTSPIPTGRASSWRGTSGPRPEERFDAITHRAFFERLRRTGVITLEGLEREIAARRTGLDRGAGEPAAHAAHARADERLGGAGVLERGPAAGRAGASATSACARPTRPTRSSCSAASRPASASRCRTRRSTSA